MTSTWRDCLKLQNVHFAAEIWKAREPNERLCSEMLHNCNCCSYTKEILLSLPSSIPCFVLMTVSGYSYIDCYRDNTDRALNGATLSSTSMTVETCQQFCKNYTYFGLEVQLCVKYLSLKRWHTLKKIVPETCTRNCQTQPTNQIAQFWSRASLQVSGTSFLRVCLRY